MQENLLKDFVFLESQVLKRLLLLRVNFIQLQRINFHGLTIKTKKDFLNLVKYKRVHDGALLCCVIWFSLPFF